MPGEAAISELTKYGLIPAVLDVLHEGVAVYRADRTLLYINEAMRAATGGAQVLGAEMQQVGTRHRVFTEDGRELAEAEFPIERAFRGEETKETLFQYIDRAQHRTWLSVDCRCIRDEDGALRFIVTTIWDRTHRKTRDDKLRFLMESAKILSLTADPRQRLIEKAKLAVPSLADWCGIDILTPDDRVERIAVIHQDSRQIELLEQFERQYPTDQSAPGSIYNTIKSGTSQFASIVTDDLIDASTPDTLQREAVKKFNLHSIIVVPIMANGRGLGAMTLAYAESGRVYAQEDLRFFEEFGFHVGVVLENARLFTEVERRDSAKDLFLASLSHELRNPLAPIKSSIELLKFKDLLPDVREELSVIEHQFDHMARLLNDLLDVSRFTSSKISINPRTIKLRSVIERALRSTDALLKTADIALNVSYADADLFIRADETRLEQAIVNLMTNAAKFTPAGGSIWVSTKKDGGRATVRIRDNGAGIAPEDLQKIFEMYYQGSRARNVNAGLGIGLLLVKEIMTLHGGTVAARSEGVGKGSEFEICLPLAEAPADAPKQGTRATELSGKRIVVVDDNMPAADSLARLLEKLGAAAEAVYSGEELLDRDDLAVQDLFLIDIGMPRLDGYGVVQTLRGRGLAQPMIALTGYGMAEDKQKALTAGFSAHLTKPVGVSDLREAFAHLVQ